MMKQKILTAMMAVIAITAVAYQYQERRMFSQQKADYQAHVAQLLQQVDAGSRARLADQNELSQLRSELATLGSQMAALSNELDLARAQANPDYEAVEQQIRQRLERELRQAQPNNYDLVSTTEIIKNLSNLSPVEMAELMSLNGQYGGFLSQLDVDDERMDVIINALQNVISEQNQARSDLIQQVRNGETDRRSLREGLASVTSPETQRESLGHILTDEELAVYDSWRETQQSSTMAGATFIGGTGTTGNGPAIINFSGGDGSAEAGTIKLDVISLQPDNQ